MVKYSNRCLPDTRVQPRTGGRPHATRVFPGAQSMKCDNPKETQTTDQVRHHFPAEYSLSSHPHLFFFFKEKDVLIT